MSAASSNRLRRRSVLGWCWMLPAAALADSGPPALFIVGATTLLLSVLWMVPLQWAALRKAMPEMTRSQALLLVIQAKGASLVGALVPIYLAWALLSTWLKRAGVPESIVDRVFVLSFDEPAVDAVAVLLWLVVAFAATVAVEAAFLRWKWRKAPPSAEPWLVAFRVNRLTFLIQGLISIGLTVIR